LYVTPFSLAEAPWASPSLFPGQPHVGIEALLDLNFLTEEEQNAIVEVLQRDLQLQMSEEGRINKLRKSISDPNWLKIFSGEWFRDVRSKRHQCNLFGADIVRASIRRKKKPKGKRRRCLTLLLSQKCFFSRGSWTFWFFFEDVSLLIQEAFSARSALVSSPSKANPVSPSNKGLNASSSTSSLSSSTMSGSMASMFSDNDIGSIDVRGCIQFSLRYDSSKKEFHIQIIQCRDLAEAKKQRSDPYVKTYLLPDRSNHSKRKTAVKKRSLDPIFNETLKLEAWLLLLKEPAGLCPSRNFKNIHLISSSSSSYILPDDTKLSRQKTRIVKKNLNPTFNHTMVYDGFELKDLAEACAEFTVWHRETFSKHRLGGIRLSLGTGNSYGLPVPWMDSTEEERHTWEMVFKQPQQWVEATLPLRTNLTLRTSS
uniref:Synaptotagmin like 1 n=1 Tax=Pseudonaja textilis TaxID=8673 RepID=A0A670Y6S1_PSETE